MMASPKLTLLALALLMAAATCAEYENLSVWARDSEEEATFFRRTLALPGDDAGYLVAGNDYWTTGIVISHFKVEEGGNMNPINTTSIACPADDCEHTELFVLDDRDDVFFLTFFAADSTDDEDEEETEGDALTGVFYIMSFDLETLDSSQMITAPASGVTNSAVCTTGSSFLISVAYESTVHLLKYDSSLAFQYQLGASSEWSDYGCHMLEGSDDNYMLFTKSEEGDYELHLYDSEGNNDERFTLANFEGSNLFISGKADGYYVLLTSTMTDTVVDFMNIYLLSYSNFEVMHTARIEVGMDEPIMSIAISDDLERYAVNVSDLGAGGSSKVWVFDKDFDLETSFVLDPSDSVVEFVMVMMAFAPDSNSRLVSGGAYYNGGTIDAAVYTLDLDSCGTGFTTIDSNVDYAELSDATSTGAGTTDSPWVKSGTNQLTWESSSEGIFDGENWGVRDMSFSASELEQNECITVTVEDVDEEEDGDEEHSAADTDEEEEEEEDSTTDSDDEEEDDQGEDDETDSDDEEEDDQGEDDETDSDDDEEEEDTNNDQSSSSAPLWIFSMATVAFAAIL